MGWAEYNSLANLSKTKDTSMSWMIREALKEKYPELYLDINRPKAPQRTKYRGAAPVSDDLMIED